MSIKVPLTSRQFCLACSLPSLLIGIIIICTAPFPYTFIGIPFTVAGFLVTLFNIIFWIDDGGIQFKDKY